MRTLRGEQMRTLREMPLISMALTIRRRIIWALFYRRLRNQSVINSRFDETYGTDTASEIDLVTAGVPARDAARGRGSYRPFWEF